MKISAKNGIIKQTALLLLCGLLPCLCLAQQRSVSEATKVANAFLNEALSLPNVSDIQLKLSSSIISLGEELQSGREAFYIFAAKEKGNGFVIVSGDKRMPDVLAYSDENLFDVDNIPPNVRYWLDCYAEAIFSLDDEYTSESKQLSSVNPNGVVPLLGKNKWGQDDPFNRFCPAIRNDRCLTGCVATAMAQVMKYHRSPSTGTGSMSYYTDTNHFYLQKDFSAVQFKWDDMLDDYKGKYTAEQADAVAELMYACGISVKMDYGMDVQLQSGALQTDLVNAFVDNFRYDSDAAFMHRSYCSVDEWHQFLVDELNEGRPVNYAGSSPRGGHSFVLDGYRTNSDNKYPDYHVNWGWNGNCDGYYQIADLHPSENGQHATYAGYNSSQQMTIGIMPEDGIDNGVTYLCTPNLYVSSSSAKPGDNLNIYTASCANFSYKPYSGSLCVVLISSEDGSETILGESRIKTLTYMQEHNNLNINVTLPPDLADGQYRIQLRSKQSGKREYHKVVSRQYPLLTISATGEDIQEVGDEVMLGCSELEVLSDSDPTLIELKVYELQNLLEYPFIGDLKMILADKTGIQLCSFGDSIQPGELSTYEIQENPIRIRGQLTGNWPEGDYRLYVGARQINTSNFVYLSYFDITKPDVTYHDMSINAQIKDGRLIVNDKAYVISPTSIKQTEIGCLNDDGDNLEIYRFDGMKRRKGDMGVETLTNGVYIIRGSNQTRKVLGKIK